MEFIYRLLVKAFLCHEEQINFPASLDKTRPLKGYKLLVFFVYFLSYV